MRRHKA